MTGVGTSLGAESIDTTRQQGWASSEKLTVKEKSNGKCRLLDAGFQGRTLSGLWLATRDPVSPKEQERCPLWLMTISGSTLLKLPGSDKNLNRFILLSLFYSAVKGIYHELGPVSCFWGEDEKPSPLLQEVFSEEQNLNNYEQELRSRPVLGLVMPVWLAGSLGGREEGLGDRRDAASSSVERVCCPCQGGMCVAACV